MSQQDITTIQLYGPAETLAIAKALEQRMQLLSALKTSEANMEFFTLQQIVIRISPQIDAKAIQERYNANAENGWML